MNNSGNKKINAEKLIESIQFAEVNGQDPSLLSEAKILLIEYGGYMFGELNFMAGKENFFKELEHFPGDRYLRPSGIFVIVKAGTELVGCVGIKKFGEYSCEMKRMYIRATFRGKGISGLMWQFVIEWCRKSTYKRILLDSNTEMKEAVALYHKCGFKEIGPYCINENDHPVFMEYVL